MSALSDLYTDDAYPSLLHSNAVELPAAGQEDIYDGNGNKSSLKLGRSCNGATVCGPLVCDSLLVNNPSTVMSFMLDTIYPINSIYLSLNSTSPGAHLGGTWIQISKGRMLAGEGSDIDTAGNAGTLAVGNNQGEYVHTLTATEMPVHSHSPIYLQTSEDDNPDSSNPSQSVIDNDWAASGGKLQAGSYTGNAGGGLPHNNLPPYFAVYIWQRQA